MKRIVGLLYVLLPLGVFAQGAADSWVQFDRDFPSRPIGDQLQLLDDPTGQLTIVDVLKSQDFQQSTLSVPNFGISPSAYWAKFTLLNIDPDEKAVIHIDYPEIEQLDVYLVKNGTVHHILESGQSRPAPTEKQDSPTSTSEINLPYGGMGSVYVRIKSDKQLQLPIFLVTKQESARIALSRNLFIGGYIGIMLVMLLYNLFIFLSTRDRNYFLYSIYIVFVLLAQMSFIGFLSYYAYPNNIWLKEHSSLILTVCTAISANIFMNHFIQAEENVRHFRPVMGSFYLLLVVGVVLDIIGLRLLAYGMVQALSLILAIYVLAVAIIVTRRNVRSAKFFLVAWCIFLTGIVIFVFKDWGIVPYNDLTKHMMTIGSAVEVVLLSFGLADKINVLRREKELSQAEALRMAKENERFIRDQNVVLEQKVTERTHALQESNDHLKRTQSQLVSAEKMASLGQLTAGIAHEINNPLNFISSNIPPLKRDLQDLKEVLDAYRAASKDNPAMRDIHALEERIGVDFTVKEVHEILACMETGAARTSEIVQGLRTFSRLDEDDLKEADINEGLRSTVVVLGPQFRDQVKVHYDLADLPPLECFPGKLNQLFMNLLNNAAHAVKQRHGESGGVVGISTRVEGDQVVVRIEDNGMGMDESIQARLFEPFFTTKEVGEGTGLGLSIAQGIAEKHHGRITVESVVAQGTVFTITLPVRRSTDYAKSA